MAKQNKTICPDSKIWTLAENMAKADLRSTTGFIEWLITQEYEKRAGKKLK